MARNILTKQRSVWKDVNYFINYYNLKRSTAYKIINQDGFPKKRVGIKKILIDVSRTDEFFEKYN